jgi:hypothetical protein
MQQIALVARPRGRAPTYCVDSFEKEEEQERRRRRKDEDEDDHQDEVQHEEEHESVEHIQ